MKRLVLLGAGHAHLVALREFARQRLPDTELIVVTPSRWQYYSGMIPGWVAGYYTLDQCRVPVAPTVRAAGGSLVLDRAVELVAANREVVLASGTRLTYDLLSIDVGSMSEGLTFGGAGLSTGVFGVKPMDELARQWLAAGPRLAAADKPTVTVLGGGAGGVELALAIAGEGRRVVLVAGAKGIVPGFGRRFRRRVGCALMKRDVGVVDEYAELVRDGIRVASGRQYPSDVVLIATGGVALPFLRDSGLAVDDDGFVLVDACHQSQSTPNVFAVGDACSRVDRRLDRSGVHAVRAGPVLARNLASALAGQPLKPFYPRRFSLYLLATGDRAAIGSYGPVTFSGSWVWKWKDRIDRGFVEGFPKQ